MHDLVRRPHILDFGSKRVQKKNFATSGILNLTAYLASLWYVLMDPARQKNSRALVIFQPETALLCMLASMIIPFMAGGGGSVMLFSLLTQPLWNFQDRERPLPPGGRG